MTSGLLRTPPLRREAEAHNVRSNRQRHVLRSPDSVRHWRCLDGGIEREAPHGLARALVGGDKVAAWISVEEQSPGCTQNSCHSFAVNRADLRYLPDDLDRKSTRLNSSHL